MPQIQAVADGTEKSAIFKIPADVLSYTFDCDEIGVPQNASDYTAYSTIGDAIYESGFDRYYVINTLMYACPFDLYWWDKTTYTSYEFSWAV